ncbi:unnamed protein product [Orchesella dallaii]|uniref:Uncharacterized protein n=1 Tax=Orchesella dallaii TaxID=48710 RepID=A0ABP1S3Y0_9HEXA
MILKPWLSLLSLFPLLYEATAFLPKESSNLATNIWREERQAIRIPEDPATLYGNERHCISPEPAELTTASTHTTGTWSEILSIYTLDAGDELEAWLKFQETHPGTTNEKLENTPIYETLFPLIVPLIFAAFLSASVLLIPLLGALGFHCLVIVWWVITHPEMKRCGRRSLIMFEQVKRKRQEILLRESMIKASRSRFYLPEFFRLYSDEDVPTELEESDESDELEDFVQAPTKEQEETKKENGSLSGLDVEVEEDSDEQDQTNNNNQTRKDRFNEQVNKENKGMFAKVWAWLRARRG